MKFKLSFGYLILSILSVFFFAGCVASSDDSSSSGDASGDSITGTAAAGAPIVGVVNAKGANGNTASGNIESDGSYELDVTDLTAPYVLKAWGTVNGESIELYSTGVAAGNINITPITDYITARALAIDPADAFDEWNTASTSVTAEVLEVAEAEVQEQLAVFIEAFGLDENVDLMSVQFDTDHSGLDAILDVIEIEFDDSNNVTITNTITGTQVSGDEGFDSSEVAELTEAINEMAEMNVFWDAFSALYATEAATAAEINSEIAPLVANDLLDNGKSKEEQLSQFATSGNVPVGVEFEVVISGEMESSEFDDTLYTKGYWVNLFYSVDGELLGSDTQSMVYNGTNWLWHGNRRIFSYDIQYRAEKDHEYDGSVTYQSEMHFWINDEFNYAHTDLGVQSLIITGPSPIPDDGLVMYRDFAENEEFEFVFNDDNEIVLTDDSEIASFPENAEITIRAYTEAPDIVNLASHTPVATYTETAPGKPFLNSELTDDLFPTLTSHSTHSISDLNIGGDITFTWTIPENTSLRHVDMWWGLWENGAEVGEFRLEANNPEGNSHTFDTSENNLSSVNYSGVAINVKDVYGRKIELEWGWW